MSFLSFEALCVCLTRPNAVYHKDLLKQICDRIPKIMIDKLTNVDDRAIRDIRRE